VSLKSMELRRFNTPSFSAASNFSTAACASATRKFSRSAAVAGVVVVAVEVKEAVVVEVLVVVV